MFYIQVYNKVKAYFRSIYQKRSRMQIITNSTRSNEMSRPLNEAIKKKEETITHRVVGETSEKIISRTLTRCVLVAGVPVAGTGAPVQLISTLR